MSNESERAAFEKYFSESPFAWNFENLGDNSCWPGSYKEYYVECAWKAWIARSKNDVTLEDLNKLRAEISSLRYQLIAAQKRSKAVPIGWYFSDDAKTFFTCQESRLDSDAFAH